MWLTRVLAAVGLASLLTVLVGTVYATSVLRRGISAREEPSWVERRLAASARAWSVPARARSWSNPLKATPDVLADARAHWDDHCATCHAKDGSGDTPIGKNLFPRTPDMRAPSTQALSDGELYYTIQNGIRMSGMPAWGDPQDEAAEESWALVAFIRTLPGRQERVPAPQEEDGHHHGHDHGHH